MVSVVVLFQHSIGIFRLYAEIPGHGFNIPGQIAPYLLLRQSADVIVSRIHGDVVKVVQVAEHADLAELRDSGQEGKLNVSVAGFQGSVETLKGGAVFVLKSIVAYRLQDRFVVLVHEDDHSPVGFFIGSLNDSLESSAEIHFSWILSIQLLPAVQHFVQNIVQSANTLVFLCV